MPTDIVPTRDPSTLSNYNYFRTTHTTTNFTVNFANQKLVGNVMLQLQSLTDALTKEIVLDTSYLDISEVKVNGVSANWDVLPRTGPLGSPLKIQLENGIDRGKNVDVHISVSTTKQCTALQWLTPAQTSNKKHPYMVSQCQAIHCRSLFPCQDTPDVKSIFTFNITSPLHVIASGINTSEKSDSLAEEAAGQKRYSFKQDVPIPSYLYALASGDILEAPIGPRSVIATGPDELKECQWELEADTERFLQAAEEIVYPYVWGQYNVLVVPPSFPYGGMENPIYTFATPTIISGDRENVDVIAHELSHSWSGNLVTNATWESFWLNEGWTTYLERRIQAVIHGEPHRDFSAIIGWKALTDSINNYGEDHEFTKLCVNLKGGADPDDAFSSIPYEKGFIFLYHLEKLLGKEKWDKFIPHYFTTFKKCSLDTEEFKSCLFSFFAPDSLATESLTHLDWDMWYHAPGFPPKPVFDTTMVDVVYALADKWTIYTQESSSSESQEKQAADGNRDGNDENEKEPPPFEPSPSDTSSLLSNQIVVFLERVLLFPTPLTPAASRKMGDVYRLSTSKNVEISSRYFQVGLKAGDPGVVGPTTDLLGKVGRMKFVRPLYRNLERLDRDVALTTFERNKAFYHPICRGMVEKDLFGKVTAYE